MICTLCSAKSVKLSLLPAVLEKTSENPFSNSFILVYCSRVRLSLSILDGVGRVVLTLGASPGLIFSLLNHENSWGRQFCLYVSFVMGTNIATVLSAGIVIWVLPVCLPSFHH